MISQLLGLLSWLIVGSTGYHFGGWWGLFGAAGLILLIECATDDNDPGA